MKRTKQLVLAAVLMLPLMLQTTPPAFAMEKMISSGSFTGASNHKTSGTVAIVEDGGSHKVVFKDNFLFDGAPDPKIAFGNNGFVKSTIIAKLAKVKGAQEYAVPASIDVSKFNEVWIWCEKFNVPLGMAKIK